MGIDQRPDSELIPGRLRKTHASEHRRQDIRGSGRGPDQDRSDARSCAAASMSRKPGPSRLCRRAVRFR